MGHATEKRCGLVIRVSTEEQALNKEGSVTNQLQRLRAHIDYKTSACDEDWREVDRFVLRGVSGKDSIRSPEFARLFDDIRVGRINTVLCTALDRVSRSVKDFLHFFEFLNEHDVEFVCLKQNYDTTSPQGKLFITIMMALAEFEREQTSERNKDTALARAERGLWNGGQILGYDLDPDKPGHLFPNERESAIVNLAFDTYLTCGSILKTAEFLNEKGLRTKEYRSRRDRFHPAAQFGHTTVQRLLTNWAYVGKKEVNKKKKAKDQNSLPEGQRYRIVDAVWDPVVEESKFLEVQELLKKNHQSKHNGMKSTRHTYVLNAGLLQCGQCGTQMEGRCGTGAKGIKYYYYLCKNQDCRYRIPAGEIESVVLQRIQQLATQSEMLDDIVKATNEKLRTDLPKLLERKSLMEKELATVQNEAAGLLEQWDVLTSGDGVDFVKERLDSLGKRRTQLENEIDDSEVAIDEIEREAVDQGLVTQALANFGDVYDGLPPYQKKELIRLVVHRATVSHDRLELALYGKPPQPSQEAGGAVRSETSDWLPEQDSNSPPPHTAPRGNRPNTPAATP